MREREHFLSSACRETRARFFVTGGACSVKCVPQGDQWKGISGPVGGHSFPALVRKNGFSGAIGNCATLSSIAFLLFFTPPPLPSFLKRMLMDNGLFQGYDFLGVNSEQKGEGTISIYVFCVY